MTLSGLPIRPSVVDELVEAAPAEETARRRAEDGQGRGAKIRRHVSKQVGTTDVFRRVFRQLAERDELPHESKRMLIEANLGLVVSSEALSRSRPVAARSHSGGKHWPDEAADRFQFRRGFRFSTRHGDRQAIGRAVADYGRTIRLPVHVVESLGKVERGTLTVKRTTASRASRSAQPRSTCRPTVRLLLESSKLPLSLDVSTHEGDDRDLGERVADRAIESPEDELLRGELATRVERALARLDDREKEVLRMRFGLASDHEYTLAEIARRFNLSRERVRQSRRGAINYAGDSSSRQQASRQPAAVVRIVETAGLPSSAVHTGSSN
jgi:RNA polymerase primary sigma factor